MPLTNEQMDTIKSRLQNEELLIRIKNDMGLEDSMADIRQQLFDTFGEEEITTLIQGAREVNRFPTFALVHSMIDSKVVPRKDKVTVAKLDKMIDNLNSAINRLLTIKSEIDK